MLNPAFNKKYLFGTTVIAGFAALTVVSGPAHAQTVSTDAAIAQQQSPEQGAPPQTAPDPAIVDQPDNPNEARNNAGEPVSDDASEVEAVVVTGSRIRRDPTNAPAPLIQVGREEILQSGQANIIDFLSDIPALQTSFTPADQATGGLNIGGLSFVNLRNLGTARTLVLVDGRRHVGSNIGGLQVDIDSIPSLLIESTELVTGGQSALYGTDAVAGVVNFILRRNFEGIELDASYNELNQEGQSDRRISGLVGKNFFNDRLNVYAFGEYQKGDEVRTRDIDYLREGNNLLNVDSDPSTAEADGDLDNILISGQRDLLFARGGLLVLSNQVRPSTGFIPGTTRIADPDFTIQNCGAVPPPNTRPFSGVSANCTNVAPDQPGTAFVFNADGTARLANFGTFQDTNGNNRRVNIGGDGLNQATEFLQPLRYPELEAMRFQAGFNLDVNDSLQLFGEAKYIDEETLLISQPSFFTLAITDVPAGGESGLFGTSGFNIGLDNPFLPANAAAAIRANRRPVYDLRQTLPNPVAGGAAIQNLNFGNQTGTIDDPRAVYNFFGPDRPQVNTRELERYVVGLRGDRDRLGFVENLSYEASYTYGEVRNRNDEFALDSERFFYALDTVRGANGQAQCRVQALAAAGVTITDQVRPLIGSGTEAEITAQTGRNPTLAANDPIVTGCTPINPFGADFRGDSNAEFITGGGGRPGLTAAQQAYILAAVNVEEVNKQSDFLGFVSGEILGDFLPAGPIGIALGYEYREEKFSGIGRTAANFDAQGRRRLLFLNTSLDNPEVGYDSNEVFGEIRIPLLRNMRLADTAEISAAYRKAENSVESVGELETYSVQGLYRPTRDILFRATYGEAVRIPTLSDLFNQGFQTFALIGDPCDANSLRTQPDPVIRANRRANCVALLGQGYDPDSTQLIYQSSIEGRGGAGSPLLQAEDSRSYTFSVSLTPRFIPRFSLVLDYYNIKLSNAIQTVSAQANVNNCVSGVVINEAACATFVRNGLVPPPGSTGQANQPFALRSFAQGAQNYAASTAQGMDFNMRYALDTVDILGRDLGRFDYSMRGNYLIRQETFVNINDPSDATENDSGPGQPRVRLLSTLTYSPIDPLSFTWNWDFQTSQELFDSDLLLQDPDNRRAEFLETGSFSSHDFSARYELRDGITLRAGVVNAFDAEPPAHVQQATVQGAGIDVLDLFGRRFFVGANVKFGAARN